GVDEWRRQRLSAGPRAVSQILRLTSTPTATTLEFFRFGADRRAVCWLPISVRAPRLERPAPRSHSFYLALYQHFPNAVCVITNKNGGARLFAPSLAGKLYPFPKTRPRSGVGTQLLRTRAP